MKYRDLIQFDPIETIIHLRAADQRTEAERLVRTYVISDRLAELLIQVVIPQLQHTEPADNRGLFIVGNYGTGKSHLMSVLSAVAEHNDLAGELTHPGVAEHIQKIAGRFKVVRAEIGTTTMRLRDILLDELEAGLADLGIDFTFPTIDQVSNSKDILMEMMEAFDAQYPETGLLLVVDELLEFLRSRHDQDLILDLSFLRELGEISRDSRFRFVAGIQESLFDSPRFQFVADAIRRVKDRFEQVRIAREDVAFVVAERLLKKSDEQKRRIRQHLAQFTPLYGNMAEKIEDFVRLFPVHPAYLETFERIYVVEKREVLKTLSAAMQSRLAQDVSRDEPGLIAYDSYWANLRDNPSFRSEPEIKEVIDKSQVLADRVSQALPRAAYKPAALRLINALSVHRLTIGDIYAPLGATAEELRDNLALSVAGLPEQEADFLRATIESILAEISKTVSGQFITFNPENGQYYLDLKKDIDFDALVNQRAESLDDNLLDRYYFTALTEVMEKPAEATYVPGFRIWSHEIEWLARRVTRPGYLFFGAPNERSTAQPPREFYLYIIQPHNPPPFTDAHQDDEVFFRLARPDADFQQILKRYAGAREMAGAASGENKLQYERKATTHLRNLQSWLRNNLAQAMDVTFQGATKPLIEWTRAGAVKPGSTASVRDLVNSVAAACLAPTFADKLPDYPTFKFLITQGNRSQAAGEAIRWLAGSLKTQQGGSALDALGLLDSQNHISPRGSRYAADFLQRLANKAEGQVVNRAELIEGALGAEKDTRFGLELNWVVVILLALVHNGDIVLALPGRVLDAGNLEETAKLSLDELAGFKFYRRPQGVPLGPLTELFELLDLRAGLIRDSNKHREATEELSKRVTAELDRLVRARQWVLKGLPLADAAILEGQVKTTILRQLDEHKTFLESLQAYNQPGKLRNFRYTSAEVQAEAAARRTLAQVEQLAGLIADLQPLVAYLGVALALLPADHPWSETAKKVQQAQLAQLRDERNWSTPTLRATLSTELERLKAEYVQTYLELHRRARLNHEEEARRRQLKSDAGYRRLVELAGLQFMPVARLKSWEEGLNGLKACQALGAADLKDHAFCQRCGYRPAQEPLPSEPAQAFLDQKSEELATLHQVWTATLLTTLKQETPQQTLALLAPTQQKFIKDFLKVETLPGKISYDFVEAIKQALEGLEQVAIDPSEILLALTDGEMPCTIPEIERRFRQFIEGQTQGKNPNNLRIIVNW